MKPADHETHPNLEILTLFHDGEGDSKMLLDIEEHLGTCDICRAELERLQQLSAQLASVELSAPADLGEKIQQGIAEGPTPIAEVRRAISETPAAPRSLNPSPWWGRVAALFLIGFVIGGAWWWREMGPGAMPETQLAKAPSTLDEIAPESDFAKEFSDTGTTDNWGKGGGSRAGSAMDRPRATAPTLGLEKDGLEKNGLEKDGFGGKALEDKTLEDSDDHVILKREKAGSIEFSQDDMSAADDAEVLESAEFQRFAESARKREAPTESPGQAAGERATELRARQRAAADDRARGEDGKTTPTAPSRGSRSGRGAPDANATPPSPRAAFIEEREIVLAVTVDPQGAADDLRTAILRWLEPAEESDRQEETDLDEERNLDEETKGTADLERGYVAGLGGALRFRWVESVDGEVAAAKGKTITLELPSDRAKELIASLRSTGLLDSSGLADTRKVVPPTKKGDERRRAKGRKGPPPPPSKTDEEDADAVADGSVEKSEEELSRTQPRAKRGEAEKTKAEEPKAEQAKTGKTKIRLRITIVREPAPAGD